ncbi:MAG: glycosyltransferase [bacterium]|nr:glycosyltransferase [bacterium]
MKTTLVMPTLNEIGSIEKSLTQLPKDLIDEVLVVDGYSTDGTVELVRKLGYPLIFQEKKDKGLGASGFGSAISTGIKHAKGDTIIIMSADGSQNVNDIPLLLKKIEEGCDLVLASRYLPEGGSEDDTPLHRLGNRFFTFLCNQLYGIGISDSLYFFLAARKEMFDKFQLESPDAGCCVELPIKAHRAGFKIGEIPSFERKRATGQGKLNAFIDGLKILFKILKPY